MVKRLFVFIILIIALLLAVVLVNTYRTPSQQLRTVYSPVPALSDSSISHLQQAVRCQTVSFTDTSKRDTGQFIRFQQFLQHAYPLVHKQLQLQHINRYTLLYRWKGRNPSAPPVVLMAHQDVVPVEKATLGQWKTDPFSGTVKDSCIWGRGAVDDKVSLIAILEATEKLLAEGYVPPRDYIFSFGHDEEIGGQKGALAVATLLKKRGIKPAFVLDEGGIITKKEIPGISRPVALIGTAEKGYVSVNMTVTIPGGHSSMPKAETAIDVLSKSLVKLHEQQFKPEFSKATQDFMKHLGPEMPFLQRMAFANKWLFKPLIIHIYTAKPGGNAIVRTTTAATILSSGIKDNVIPSQATAVMNFRTLPGTSTGDVLAHIRSVVNDSRVKLSVSGFANEASPVSSADNEAYKKIAAAVKSTNPDIITAPFLMVGATDAHHFTAISNQVYRLQAVTDPIGFHGLNERVSLQDYGNFIAFYYRLIKE